MAARLVRLPASVADALGLISPAANLARIATGCIELSAILNFVILSALVLWLAATAINDRRAGTHAPGSAFNKAGKGALAILGGLSLMTIAATVDVQADLTEGRQYTLHPATIAAARALPSSSAKDLL